MILNPNALNSCEGDSATDTMVTAPESLANQTERLRMGPGGVAGSGGFAEGPEAWACHAGSRQGHSLRC